MRDADDLDMVVFHSVQNRIAAADQISRAGANVIPRGIKSAVRGEAFTGRIKITQKVVRGGRVVVGDDVVDGLARVSEAAGETGIPRPAQNTLQPPFSQRLTNDLARRCVDGACPRTC